MLASALKLTGPVQEAFVAAARGRAESARVLAVRSEAAPESSAAAATRTLPRDIGGFTGRERELTGLENSLAKVAGGGLAGIYAIDGMAGIGKTTFAVHAAHRLAGRFPDGQFFLPLHAHTAGQSPACRRDDSRTATCTAPGYGPRYCRYSSMACRCRRTGCPTRPWRHPGQRPGAPGSSHVGGGFLADVV